MQSTWIFVLKYHYQRQKSARSKAAKTIHCYNKKKEQLSSYLADETVDGLEDFSKSIEMANQKTSG